MESILDRLSEAQLNELFLEYQSLALRLFAKQRVEIMRLLANAASDRERRAAVAMIQRQLTLPDGRFREAWRDAFAEANEKVLTRAARVSLRALDFGKVANESIPLTAYVRADTLAEHIGETSAARVTDAVYTAIQEGHSAAAAIVTDAFGSEISRTRAERIARTETHGTLVQGEFDAMVEVGIFRYKEWLHSGNRRQPREDHIAIDGERVPIDEPFSNGLMFPGDQAGLPEDVINCGCGVLYFTDA